MFIDLLDALDLFRQYGTAKSICVGGLVSVAAVCRLVVGRGARVNYKERTKNCSIMKRRRAHKTM